jgi:hypothetical protein
MPRPLGIKYVLKYNFKNYEGPFVSIDIFVPFSKGLSSTLLDPPKKEKRKKEKKE